MSIDTLPLNTSELVPSHIPYTASVPCGDQPPALWFEGDRQLIVRQSADLPAASRPAVT